MTRANSSARNPGVRRVSTNSAKVPSRCLDSDDSATPWASAPAYELMLDAVSASASASCSLSSAAVPSESSPMHTEARPSLPTGSFSLPPSKVRSMLTIGSVCCSTR
jgi:hypothetical protein